ncbi:MAG: hypothetical protein NZ602_04050 [Thermoguttaceae bacterium]|nr:hypothetical protein [Thermoguttaceae bacterium]MDW8036589.1 hypothetical protein [Thermoguttaceae bacterium]
MSQTDRSFCSADRPRLASEAVPQGALRLAEELRRRSRRSLFRAGLTAAPLILTLRNRAAWGQSGGQGTVITPISEAKRKGLSEEEIELLRRQLQQAEGRSGYGWPEEDAGGF